MTIINTNKENRRITRAYKKQQEDARIQGAKEKEPQEEEQREGEEWREERRKGDGEGRRRSRRRRRMQPTDRQSGKGEERREKDYEEERKGAEDSTKDGVEESEKNHGKKERPEQKEEAKDTNKEEIEEGEKEAEGGEEEGEKEAEGEEGERQKETQRKVGVAARRYRDLERRPPRTRRLGGPSIRSKAEGAGDMTREGPPENKEGNKKQEWKSEEDAEVWAWKEGKQMGKKPSSIESENKLEDITHEGITRGEKKVEVLGVDAQGSNGRGESEEKKGHTDRGRGDKKEEEEKAPEGKSRGVKKRVSFKEILEVHEVTNDNEEEEIQIRHTKQKRTYERNDSGLQKTETVVEQSIEERKLEIKRENKDHKELTVERMETLKTYICQNEEVNEYDKVIILREREIKRGRKRKRSDVEEGEVTRKEGRQLRKGTIKIREVFESERDSPRRYSKRRKLEQPKVKGASEEEEKGIEVEEEKGISSKTEDEDAREEQLPATDTGIHLEEDRDCFDVLVEVFSKAAQEMQKVDKPKRKRRRRRRSIRYKPRKSRSVSAKKKTLSNDEDKAKEVGDGEVKIESVKEKIEDEDGVEVEEEGVEGGKRKEAGGKVLRGDIKAEDGTMKSVIMGALVEWEGTSPHQTPKPDREDDDRDKDWCFTEEDMTSSICRVLRRETREYNLRPSTLTKRKASLALFLEGSETKEEEWEEGEVGRRNRSFLPEGEKKEDGKSFLWEKESDLGENLEEGDAKRRWVFGRGKGKLKFTTKSQYMRDRITDVDEGDFGEDEDQKVGRRKRRNSARLRKRYHRSKTTKKEEWAEGTESSEEDQSKSWEPSAEEQVHRGRRRKRRRSKDQKDKRGRKWKVQQKRRKGTIGTEKGGGGADVKEVTTKQRECREGRQDVQKSEDTEVEGEPRRKSRRGRRPAHPKLTWLERLEAYEASTGTDEEVADEMASESEEAEERDEYVTQGVSFMQMWRDSLPRVIALRKDLHRLQQELGS
ncbi:uncharacterized protein LOC143030862 [Oratosquilla oratoria]|uniref:uncharacterized protein LOC143030862 n=1 Tax=Oratosquilla oratoria TaxID=337810 RepID=UPI003F762FA1